MDYWKNHGGNAFPAGETATLDDTMGMSLRDYFAGQALVSVIQVCANDLRESGIGEPIEQMFARRAYMVADAMMAARNG